MKNYKSTYCMLILSLFFSIIGKAQNVSGFDVSFARCNNSNNSILLIQTSEYKWIWVNGNDFKNAHSIVQEKRRNTIVFFRDDARGYKMELRVSERKFYIWKKNDEYVEGYNITQLIDGPELPESSTTYNIEIQHSQKYLSLPDDNQYNGVPLIQHSESGNYRQLFEFREKGAGYYKIVPTSSKLALNLQNQNPSDWTPIQQWEDLNIANQLFILIPVNEEYFRIATLNGKTFDVYKGEYDTRDGAPIIQKPYIGIGSQHFKIKAASGDDGFSHRKGAW